MRAFWAERKFLKSNAVGSPDVLPKATITPPGATRYVRGRIIDLTPATARVIATTDLMHVSVASEYTALALHKPTNLRVLVGRTRRLA
jgi:hypothetical protein